MTASAITSTASGYGFYDLLTFVTGCSRQRVYLLPPIQASFPVVLSQVCLNPRKAADCTACRKSLNSLVHARLERATNECIACLEVRLHLERNPIGQCNPVGTADKGVNFETPAHQVRLPKGIGDTGS